MFKFSKLLIAGAGLAALASAAPSTAQYYGYSSPYSNGYQASAPNSQRARVVPAPGAAIHQVAASATSEIASQITTAAAGLNSVSGAMSQA